MRPKPKFVLEIKPRQRTDVFRRRERRVNLSYFPRKSFYHLPLKFLVVAFALFLYVGGSVLAPAPGGTLAVTEDRASLEAELRKLEAQMADYEKTISEYRSQGKSLQGEINILQTKIKQINTQIQAINLSLQRLNTNIYQTTNKIGDVEGNIDFNQEALADLIKKIDEQDQKGLMEILLENPKLSDFFGSVNDLMATQESVGITLEKLTQLRSELITQRELLAMEKEDVEALRVYQVQQKQAADGVRSEKDQLLKVTKGKESEYQKLLTETQKSAAEIRTRLYQLIGGGQMSFGQAYELASIAERATGVRAAFLLAVLDRESALGRNVGKCSYKTAMAPGPPYSSRDDVTPFLKITAELGLNPDTTLVSCPNADGAYGGAMGPAQFIPTTWVGYKDKVAAITGNSPASPWRNLDAFVAAALYLKSAGAGCNELAAAARYYCGSNWNRYVCTQVYGRNVVEKAAQFEQDIQLLKS
ncbi:MAG: lytic murein transglycosylase, partial [Candidatus Colwellbacteria bacterium]|nr:lytic murein transglycosylase [Candidatus Colwellbacteria bacterium]